MSGRNVINAGRKARSLSRSRLSSSKKLIHGQSSELKVQPIDKLLIANRGEIACRIMQSAKRMGIQSVTCYSDADQKSLHANMADEAFHIGPSPAVDSYLRMEKIINVAKKSGAQAVHPGYGFLSEKPEFANLCEDEGIIFVGPPSSAIRDMGIKSTSKYIMESAGVPVIKGYHGEDQGIETLKSEAEKIGYPVMLKAVRGGGGKGMRIVTKPEDFEAQLESAKNESLKAFDDDKFLVEKFVERPRHVEVQVFADRYGNTVYLFERDCSVQRRHQKIIEEAPAPGLSDQVRKEIGEAAVRAAKAVNYVGAGTVEFIMDKEQNFFFMEMNTRLQVEHPVSEMITGVDLVELQLRAAAGERLPFTQEDLEIKGHSFEARIYAEDPDSDFLPGTGKLHYLSTPFPSSDVRIETGVRQGDEVSQYYDPMIAKLVVWDEDRATALKKLYRKLSEYHVVGLSTNLKFLKDLASHPAFVTADVHTDFIQEHNDELFPKRGGLNGHQLAQAGFALILDEQNTLAQKSRLSDTHSPMNNFSSYRVNVNEHQSIQIKDGDQDLTLDVTYSDGNVSIKVGDEVFVCSGSLETNENQTIANVTINGQRERYSFVTHDGGLHVFTKNTHFQVQKQRPKFVLETIEAALPQGGIIAPMTGTIMEVRAKVGEEVKAGDTVAVIYAMKLEHNIVAPYDGVVEEVFVDASQMVNHNDEVLKIKEHGDE